MKKIHFYKHIVSTDSLIAALEELEISADEKTHLLALAESHVYQVVLDTILSELSNEDKKIFLEHVENNDHGKIWEHLHTKTEAIEDKIKKAAEDIKKELHNDITEVTKIKHQK